MGGVEPSGLPVHPPQVILSFHTPTPHPLDDLRRQGVHPDHKDGLSVSYVGILFTFRSQRTGVLLFIRSPFVFCLFVYLRFYKVPTKTTKTTHTAHTTHSPVPSVVEE